MAEDDPGRTRPRERGGEPSEQKAEGPPQRDASLGSNNETGTTRRQLLKAGVGLGAVGAVGYGYLRSQEEVLAARDGSTLDDVPDSAEFVFSWTGSELLTAEGLQAATDPEISTLDIDGIANTTEMFDVVESTTTIDPRELGEMTGFGAIPTETETYVGLVFESDADPQTVKGRLVDRGNLQDTVEYREQTLWVVGNDGLTWDLVFGHLGDGRYALGSQTELEDIVDIRRGEARRVGGTVMDGYENAAEGLLRGGFVVPAAAFADLDIPITAGLADSIEYGSASLSEGVLTVTLVAPDSSVAEDLDTTLNALGQLDQEDIAAQVGDSPLVQVILTILQDLDTTVSGREVTARVSDGFRVPAILISYLLEQAVAA